MYTGDFPGNTSESSRPRRRREFQTTSSKRRPRGASSSEAVPHLRNRPSDISDLTTRFPQPPSHIPLSLAQLNGTRSLHCTTLFHLLLPRFKALFSPSSISPTRVPSTVPKHFQGILPQAHQKVLQKTAVLPCFPGSNLRGIR